jgi:hypothetical protein
LPTGERDLRLREKSHRWEGDRVEEAVNREASSPPNAAENQLSGGNPMKSGNLTRISILLVAGLSLTFVVSMRAQVQSATTTTHGPSTKSVDVERGEVIYVSGNEVMVKMENGEIRDFPNVSESARVTVDGQELGIHDIKVGMKLQKTITTTTTPKVITKVETVTGKVWHVSPPNTVILTLENGENQQFRIPKDQKFTVDGQTVDAFGLKKGMNVSVTRVTEVPETVQTQQAVLTGKLPPPPPPPADAPILVAVAAPKPVPAAAAAAEAAPTAEAAPASLPKTGSLLPLIGLAGVLMLAMGLSLRVLGLGRNRLRLGGILFLPHPPRRG